jgi:retinol dehydrogenase 12
MRYYAAMTDLAHRTFLITGGNCGIGRATAASLAARGANVVIASRSEVKTAPVLEQLRMAFPEATVSFLSLDLADLSSVRRAADTFLDSGRPLDVLINNAGVAGLRGLTRDGFELTYGTNHLGPFLLTERLLPKLRESARARIVNVSSKAHLGARGIDWDSLTRPAKSRSGFPEYRVSKLMNVLHAKELARRLQGTSVMTYSLHPGVVASDIWRQVPAPFRVVMKLFMLDNERGAETSLHCATSAGIASHTGRYYDRCREAPVNPLADEVALAKKLFERSEEDVARALRSQA